MKWIINNVNSIFAFLLGAFAVFYFRGCLPEKKYSPEVIRIEGKKYEVLKHDTVYQKKTITQYRDGVYVYKYDSVYVEIPQNVDTSAILKDFYAMNMFADTLKTEIGNIVLNDTISQNKIKGRTYTASFKYPEIRTIVKERPKAAVFAGLGSSIDGEAKLQEVSAHIFLETRKRRLYGVGIGIASGAPVYKFNVLLKL
jgi:hypothetical protein